MHRRRARLETGRGRGSIYAKPASKRAPAQEAKPGTVRVVSYTPDGGEQDKTGRDPLTERPPAG